MSSHPHALLRYELLYIIVFTMTAAGQSSPETGQITGTVRDPAQAVVSGARIVITNQQTKVTATASTDERGGYVFSAAQPGAYTVEATAQGFQSAVSPELKVQAGQSVKFDFALAIAG